MLVGVPEVVESPEWIVLRLVASDERLEIGTRVPMMSLSRGMPASGPAPRLRQNCNR